MKKYFILAQSEEEEETLIEQPEETKMDGINNTTDIPSSTTPQTWQELMGKQSYDLYDEIQNLGFTNPRSIANINNPALMHKIIKYANIMPTSNFGPYSWVPYMLDGNKIETLLLEVFQKIENGEDIIDIIEPYCYESIMYTGTSSKRLDLSDELREFIKNQGYTILDLSQMLSDKLEIQNSPLMQAEKRQTEPRFVYTSKRNTLLIFLKIINDAATLRSKDIPTLIDAFVKDLPDYAHEINRDATTFSMIRETNPQFNWEQAREGYRKLLGNYYFPKIFDFLTQLPADNIYSFFSELKNIENSIYAKKILEKEDINTSEYFNIISQYAFFDKFKEDPDFFSYILKLNIPSEIKLEIINNPNLINNNNEINFDLIEKQIFKSVMPGKDPKKIAQSIQLDKTQPDYLDKLSLFLKDPRLTFLTPKSIPNIMGLNKKINNPDNYMALYNLALIFPRGDELNKFLNFKNAFEEENKQSKKESRFEEVVHKLGTAIPFIKNPKEYLSMGKFLIEAETKLRPEKSRMALKLWKDIPYDIKESYNNNRISIMDVYNYTVDLQMKKLNIPDEILNQFSETIGEDLFYKAVPEFLQFSDNKHDVYGYMNTLIHSLKTPLPDWTQITPIQLGSFVGRFLPRTDVRGLFLGHYTDCCQHPDGAASFCAFHGQTDPNGAFFVIERSKNQEIIAQSWCWASNNNVIFDNIEGYVKNEDLQPIIFKIYELAGQAIKQLTNASVLVGLGNGISNEKWPDFPMDIYDEAPTTLEYVNDFIFDKIRNATGGWVSEFDPPKTNGFFDFKDGAYSDTEPGACILAKEYIKMLKISQKLDNKKLFKTADKLDKILMRKL